MKFDLHLHSEFSWDSSVPVKDYLIQAEKQNFSAISITDHNSTDSHAIIDTLQSTTEVLLVPGQEVSTANGHLLVYGWVQQLPSGLSMGETIRLAKRDGGTCVAAHPFDPFRGGSFSRIFSFPIDGFEIFNASAWFSFPNFLAQRSYKRHSSSLLGVSNSDSHRIEEFGSAYSVSRLKTQLDHSTLFAHLAQSYPEGSRIGIVKKLSRLVRRKLI